VSGTKSQIKGCCHGGSSGVGRDRPRVDRSVSAASQRPGKDRCPSGANDRPSQGTEPVATGRLGTHRLAPASQGAEGVFTAAAKLTPVQGTRSCDPFGRSFTPRISRTDPSLHSPLHGRWPGTTAL